ncbi:MAG: MerR family transcriptional regulator [Bauldia sp.]
MASKGPQAFRTISEVAEELELPQHVLRFWETRFAQIRPMKRGGGRRYYRPDDIDLLRGICYLLYGEGYTIRGVQRILKEQGPRFVIGAGRGDMSEAFTPQPEDIGEDEEVEALALPEDEGDEAVAADGDAEADDHIEPTFDPREFRTAPPPSSGGRATAGLAPDEIRRLQSTLSDLLELKRLLDQARD